MQNYFDNNIKPLVDTLDKLTGTTHLTIRQVEDETQISVWVNDECNHAAADYQDILIANFDTDSHQWINDDSERTLVCDTCDKQLIFGEWL